MTTVDRDTRSVGGFQFACGESVDDLRLAYEAYGDPSDPTVLVCHALTGSQNVAPLGEFGEGQAGQARAWWGDVVGPGKAVDTAECHVVCVNVPGSCYGSSGPALTDPETGEPHGTDFPPVPVRDWTRAPRALLARSPPATTRLSPPRGGRRRARPPPRTPPAVPRGGPPDPPPAGPPLPLPVRSSRGRPPPLSYPLPWTSRPGPPRCGPTGGVPPR